MDLLEKGKIIGEFDLYDYGLPTTNGYLVHQISNGGNYGEKFPENREYLRIIGITNDNKIVEYGYVYFMLHVSEEGIPLSEYIGSKVMEDYRNKGIGDLLMSIYLFYSYDNGFKYVESTTRQRKLDILSLMNKYGFRLKKPEKYDNGERITIVKNKMVIDIFKENRGGIYYRFKTAQAERMYRRNNPKISNNYAYLLPQEDKQNLINYKKLGWIVPNEEYKRITDDNSLIENNLKKSGFSK